jgi:cytoskeletal protein CcmA (bactofilin family)
MKKKFIAGGVAILLLAPLIVGAASIWSQDHFVLSQNQTREGNMYVAAQEGFINGNVNGDLVIVGGNVVVSGDVSEDVLLGAGNAQLSGLVGGDARIVAGQSFLSGTVDGDVAVVAGKTYITQEGSVGGDLLVVGGETVIEGAVAGRVRISGGEVAINGTVDGDVEVQGGRLVIGDAAVIGGGLRFRGPQVPTIAPSSLIKGKVEFISDDFGGARFRYFAHGMGVLAAALGLLISLVLALVFFGLFKKNSHALTHEALAGFWPNVGRGVLTMVGLPIISLIIMLTIIGLPVGAFGLLMFGLGNILAMALSGMVFGSWVMRVLFKKDNHQPTTATVIWGTIALRVIVLVPVIGWAVGFIFCAAAFGVLSRTAYRTYWLGR